MSKRLLSLYENLLKAANLVVDEEGYVSNIIGVDKTSPEIINGKRLVLPTPEMLKKPSWSELIAFHPLHENILKGESEVLESFRNTICSRFSYTSCVLVLEMLRICASPTQHKLLSPDQQILLSNVGEVDMKTIDAFQSILMAIGARSNREGIAYIFLKRRATIGGKLFDRGGIVTFPFWKALIETTDKEIFGVKVREKDVNAIRGAFKFLFPDLDQENSYSRGSNSKIAPFTDALMQSSAAISMRINDVIDSYKDFISNADSLRINSDWVDEFLNLEAYERDIRMIPALPGNEGAEKVVVNVPAMVPPTIKTPAPPEPLPLQAPPVINQPVYNTQPNPPPVQQPAQVSGSSSMRDLLYQSQMNSQQQFPQQFPQQYQQYQQYPQQYPQQQYQQQQPMSPWNNAPQQQMQNTYASYQPQRASLSNPNVPQQYPQQMQYNNQQGGGYNRGPII